MITFTSLSPSFPVDADGTKSVEMKEQLHAEQLAVVVRLSNGKHHQVALTSEQADVLLHMIPAILDRKTLPLLPKELETIRLEPYKN